MITPVNIELVLIESEGSLAEEEEWMWAHVIDTHLDPSQSTLTFVGTALRRRDPGELRTETATPTPLSCSNTWGFNKSAGMSLRNR